MASPFKVFRKNQKAMIVLLTILTMFSFLFIPIFMDILGLRSRGPENLVVVKTTKYGNLQQSSLDHFRNNRLKVLQVMTTLLEGAGFPAQAARQFLESESMFGPPTEESVVESWLLAQYAQNLGIVLSDDVINTFLEKITQNRVRSEVMEIAIQRAGLSAEQFFNLLRHELLALKVQELFQPSLLATTPAQRWDYFNRINRYATIEAIAVPVADYVKQVASPTEKKLEEFFEKHKERIAQPESPEPGFHQPQRIALEYVKADVEKFADPKTITDQQVRQRYEKDKDRYDQLMKRLYPEKPAAEAEKKPAEAGGQPSKPAPAAPKATSKATPKGPEPPKDVHKEPAKGKDSKETSRSVSPLPTNLWSVPGEGQGVRAPFPFRLAAFAEEKKEEKKPDAKAKPPLPTKPETPALPAASPAGGEKAPAKPAAETKPQPPKTGLTDELKDRIRHEIARENVLLLLNEMSGQISDYREKWEPYHLDEIKNESRPPDQKKKLEPRPPKPKFEEFAKEHGLTAGRTPLEAQWEVRRSEIGDSQQFAVVTDAQGEPRMTPGSLVWRFAFQSPSLFRAEKSMDLKGDFYLFWKTADVKEHVPKFEDKEVQAEILRVWKLIHAQNIALKAAETLAAEARKANKPLTQVFADRPERHVILPPKFTWLNFPNVALGWQQSARLSAVEGVDMPGWDFMREVFGRERGQVGVAVNAPKTIAYVVRPTEFTPSYAVLRPLFETEPYGKYAAAGEEDRVALVRAWLNEIKKSAGFEWGPGHKTDRAADYAPTSGEED